VLALAAIGAQGPRPGLQQAMQVAAWAILDLKTQAPFEEEHRGEWLDAPVWP